MAYSTLIPAVTICGGAPLLMTWTPFPARLKKVMEFVTPLNLLDPASPEFTPENCVNLHDFVRFAHEKGMAEMFSLVGPAGFEPTPGR